MAVDADGVEWNVLRFEKPEGAQPWAGLTLVREALGSDLLGDGSEPITMRVFAAGKHIHGSSWSRRAIWVPRGLRLTVSMSHRAGAR